MGELVEGRFVARLGVQGRLSTTLAGKPGPDYMAQRTRGNGGTAAIDG